MAKQKAPVKAGKARSSPAAPGAKNNGGMVEFDEIDRLAKRWLSLWELPSTRPTMDGVIAHLSLKDQSRVIRWAQRLQKQSTAKIPREEQNGKSKKKSK